jgi:hypothetical protein
MLTTADVTACLVTRGDQPQMMDRIRDSLIFPNVVVWDNSIAPYDAKTAGRYAAIHLTDAPVVYFQDDDVIVPPATQQALLDAYEPECMVANWAHIPAVGRYGDLPLVGGGAIVDRQLPLEAIERYHGWPQDEGFLYYCDFIVGVLYPRFKHIREPFEIVMEVAQHESRLCNQPWAEDLKRTVTARARAIRDMGVLV